MGNLSEVFDAKDSNPVAAQIPIVERPEIVGEVQADVGSVEGNNEIRELVVVFEKDETVDEVHELIDEVHALVDAVAKDSTIEKAKLVDEVSIDREVATLKTLLGLIDKAGGNVAVVDVVRKRLAAIEKFPEQSVNNDSENLMLIHNVDAEDGTMFHTNDAKTHVHIDAEDGKLNYLDPGAYPSAMLNSSSTKFVIRNFLCFMRSLIIIDAAHPKGTYLGINLLADGMDGNNQIISISTGVSQGETIESWSWFLTKLKACIGLKLEAIKKLDEAGYSSWSREHCPENRYNYLTSNNAKSINALTMDVQKVPITKLLEYYRKLVQNWYCERRHKYKDAPKDELTDWAAKKVNNRMLKRANWQVDGIDQSNVY
nr:transposase, MuDR, MULE transposase domain protein [Tanacetum cinerariifolium]